MLDGIQVPLNICEEHETNMATSLTLNERLILAGGTTAKWRNYIWQMQSGNYAL